MLWYGMREYSRHLRMLSPYVIICYCVAYMAQLKGIVLLLTPLLWVTSAVGLAILLFQRFYLNRPQYSLIVSKLSGVKSDLALVLGKIAILVLLVRNKRRITPSGLAFAVAVLTLYSVSMDVRYIYGT